jgi:hypothetical protein
MMSWVKQSVWDGRESMPRKQIFLLLWIFVLGKPEHGRAFRDGVGRLLRVYWTSELIASAFFINPLVMVPTRSL